MAATAEGTSPTAEDDDDDELMELIETHKKDADAKHAQLVKQVDHLLFMVELAIAIMVALVCMVLLCGIGINKLHNENHAKTTMPPPADTV